jgi:hypothetical protein
MRLENTIHLVAGLNSEELTRLKGRQLSQSDTLGSESLERRAGQSIGVRGKASGEFVGDFEVDVHSQLR